MIMGNSEVIYAFCGVLMLLACLILAANTLKYYGIASYGLWLASMHMYFNLKSDLFIVLIVGSLGFAAFGFYTLYKYRLWHFENNKK